MEAANRWALAPEGPDMTLLTEFLGGWNILPLSNINHRATQTEYHLHSSALCPESCKLHTVRSCPPSPYTTNIRFINSQCVVPFRLAFRGYLMIQGVWQMAEHLHIWNAWDLMRACEVMSLGESGLTFKLLKNPNGVQKPLRFTHVPISLHT